MIKVLIAIGLIGVVGVALTFLPWPDISFVVYPIQLSVSYAYTFNDVFPIDTLFRLGLLAMGIEVAMYLFRIVMQLLGYVTGHKAPTDKVDPGGRP